MQETIKHIERRKDGGLIIDLEGSYSFQISAKDLLCLDLPKAGDWVQVNDGALGSFVNKVFIEGTLYLNVSPEQRALEHAQMLRGFAARDRASYERNIESWLARTELLCPEFKERMQGFADKNADFWEKSGEYELLVLEDAQIIFNYANERGIEYASERLKAFKELDYSSQRVLAKYSDQHSGFSFSAVIAMAQWLIEQRKK
jgi:hypothetical protein